MSDRPELNVAIVGLGFGAEFIPIYQRHPDAEMYAICQRTRSDLNEIGDRFGRRRALQRYEDVLADPDVDAVHINTPIPRSRADVVAALEGGQARRLHRADGDDVDECRRSSRRSGASGKVYMMMETVVYTPRVPLRQGAVRHGRDSAGCSSCAARTSRTWPAGPATGTACRRCTTRRIASARCLASRGKHAESVSCSARARIRDDLHRPSTARRSPSRPRTSRSGTPTSPREVTRSLFDDGPPVSRELRRLRQQDGRSSGTQIEDESHVVFTRASEAGDASTVPDYAALAAGADPPVHHQGRLRRRATSSTCRSSRAAATAARTRTWPTA